MSDEAHFNRDIHKSFCVFVLTMENLEMIASNIIEPTCKFYCQFEVDIFISMLHLFKILGTNVNETNNGNETMKSCYALVFLETLILKPLI